MLGKQRYGSTSLWWCRRIRLPLEETRGGRALASVQTLATRRHAQVELIRASTIQAEVADGGLLQYAEPPREASVRVEWSLVKGVNTSLTNVESARVWRRNLDVMSTRNTSARIAGSTTVSPTHA